MTSASSHTERVYAQAPQVEQNYCQGGVALWDCRNEEYYHLNDSGAEIWQHISRPSTLPALLRKLSRDFDASPGQMRDSVKGLLTQLTAAGLVESR